MRSALYVVHVDFVDLRLYKQCIIHYFLAARFARLVHIHTMWGIIDAFTGPRPQENPGKPYPLLTL